MVSEGMSIRYKAASGAAYSSSGPGSSSAEGTHMVIPLLTLDLTQASIFIYYTSIIHGIFSYTVYQ